MRSNVGTRGDSFCQPRAGSSWHEVSARVRHAVNQPPLLHQGAAGAWKSLAGFAQCDHPVGAKVPEPLAQFAPRPEHAHPVVKGQSDRPNLAFGAVAHLPPLTLPDLSLAPTPPPH